MSSVVIVGAGQAGAELAASLRQMGHQGAITLVGEEPHFPYKRPPLSKNFLTDAATKKALFVATPENYAKNAITYLEATRAVAIHRDRHELELSDGRRLPYDKLALATGGRPRPLGLPGADRANVFALRTIADVERIHMRFAAGKRLAVIGGGYIGLEVAASAVKCGLRVTVVEALPRVLARVTAPELSAFYEKVHRDAGVDLRTGAQITALEGEPEVSAVRLADGALIETDLVIYGIGIIPNIELAAAAGLEVDNGIVVDERCRTSDPDIVAAGDCTNHPSGFYGRRVRLESVQNAMEQARAAAAGLVGRDAPYQALPWFWSDQYDLKLQMVGLSTGYDEIIVRGDPAKRSFAAFYMGDGRVIAADTVNRPQEHMLARKLVASRQSVDVAQLADDAVPLKSLLAA